MDYHQYNFRANVDANMTKTTLLSLNMETIITKRNSPGYGDNNNALWSAQANLPATIVPVKYSNGTLPSFGRNSDEVSPYVQLNYTGYKISETQATRMKARLSQKLDFITKGLQEAYSRLTIPATLTSIVPRLRTYITPQEESRMEH